MWVVPSCSIADWYDVSEGNISVFIAELQPDDGSSIFLRNSGTCLTRRVSWIAIILTRWNFFSIY